MCLGVIGDAMTSLKEGDVAPEFELPDDAGRTVALSQFRGRKVVLYFYPKDDTPGCTTQAREFEAMRKEFEGRNVAILGVSPDDVESHRNFKEKYGLAFPLLADVGHQVAERYGVWVLKKMYGKEFMGISRTTFVIGANGRIESVFTNVKPEGHCDLVLAKL